MTTRGKLKSEGFVLKKKNLPSQDILLTLFTKDYGRMTLMAKGVKKLTSRRAASVQSGNLLNFVAYKRNEYYYLQETSLISAFSTIKKSSDKTSALYFLLFVVDRLLPQDVEEAEIYNLTKRYIFDLAKSQKVEAQKIEDYINILLLALGFIEQSMPLPKLKVKIEELTEQKLPFYII